MSYTPHKRSIIMASSSALLSLVVLVGAVFFLQRRIADGREIWEQAVEANGGIESVLSIKRELGDKEREIGILESFFVHDGEEVDFIEYIEYVAGQSGVETEISSLKVSSDSSGENSISQELDLRIKFEGGWSSVRSFLLGLENMPYASQFVSINVGQVGEVSWSGEVALLVTRIGNTNNDEDA